MQLQLSLSLSQFLIFNSQKVLILVIPRHTYLYYEQVECPDLQFSGPNKLGRTEYFEHLRNAKFCLAPRGESSWTLRFYESFFVVSLSLSLSLCVSHVHKMSVLKCCWHLPHRSVSQ